MPAPVPFIGASATLTFNSLTVTATKIAVPSYDAEAKDVTTLSDTAHRFIPSLPKAGEFTVTCNYDTADATTLSLATALGGASHAFTLTFHDGGTLTGSAFVIGFNVGELSPDEPQTVDIVLQPDGALTFTS